MIRVNHRQKLAAVLLGTATLSACTSGNSTDDTTTPSTAASISITTTATTASSDYVGIPGSRFVGEIAELPETDSAPYSSALIYPAQPGLQFQGPDGTYCEMYADDPATAMCTHQGEGDVNAVSVREGEPATTHNVNRIFTAHERTRVLEPGSKLVEGPVSCAVPAHGVTVMCAVGFYSFAVSRDGVELS